VKEPLVGILMATYNGEKFIKEQIDSILSQTYRNWQLLIHDDGSSDRTVKIVEEYKRKYPNKIILIEDGIKCGGAKENFAHLMLIVRRRFKYFDYIMFSDQDDVWLPEKIKITLQTILEMESKYGVNSPILVHTDLKVVDEKLNIISESFWNYQNIDPTNNALNCLILENTVTGCTMMINKALFDLVNYIPKEAIIHDWWITLVCSLFNGYICPLQEVTILYRQHSRNDTGAKGASFVRLAYRFLSNPRFFLIQKRDLARKIRLQTIALYNFAKINSRRNVLLDKYVTICDNFLLRKVFFIKNHCLCGNFQKKIGKLIFY